MVVENASATKEAHPAWANVAAKMLYAFSMSAAHPSAPLIHVETMAVGAVAPTAPRDSSAQPAAQRMALALAVARVVYPAVKTGSVKRTTSANREPAKRLSAMMNARESTKRNAPVQRPSAYAVSTTLTPVSIGDLMKTVAHLRFASSRPDVRNVALLGNPAASNPNALLLTYIATTGTVDNPWKGMHAISTTWSMSIQGIAHRA